MSRRRFLAVLATLLLLPALYAAAEAAIFQLRNRNNGSLMSSGEERDYILYVPTSYDANRPTPVVISLHGAGGWPAQQRDISGWNALAERERFIVVYPSGRNTPGPRVWRTGPGPGLDRDVRFISDLIDDLQRRYNVDASRIFANGLSNGGGMSFILSCTLSHRIAAVGLVASAQLTRFQWCTDPKPVPMIALHGTDDWMAPYRGGISPIADRPFADIEKWAASWAKRNRCAPTPIDTAAAADVVRRSYVGCAAGADVVLYTIHGGGHTWPGGQELPEWLAGKTSRSIDATAEMWDFFSRHPLRR